MPEAPRPDTGGTEPGPKPWGRRGQARSSRRLDTLRPRNPDKGPLTDTRSPRPTQGHRHSKARCGPVSSLSAAFPHTRWPPAQQKARAHKYQKQSPSRWEHREGKGKLME